MNARPCLTVILSLFGLVTAGARAGPTPDTTSVCRTLFNDLDAAVSSAGVRDQGPYPIKGYPYLRLNRFQASFQPDPRDSERFAHWVAALSGLDRSARHFELKNLPPSLRSSSANDLEQRLDQCRKRLVAVDLNPPAGRRRLLHVAQVPDEYEGSWRLLGLYPISALFVGLGVDRWHEDTRAQLKMDTGVETNNVRWWRAAGEEDRLTPKSIAHILNVSRDEMGAPRPNASDLERLFAHFAPDWGVEVAGTDDRIGKPVWRGERIAVDIRKAVEYHRVSHTRWKDRVLLQLNYIIWFPARSGDDIYAGAIDGLNWRITLDDDGSPLISDVIHNCGCYETFFPTGRLRRRHSESQAYLEPPLAFTVPTEAHRPRILLASGTHLIRQVSWDGKREPAGTLEVADYNELRSLSYGKGRRSMFGPHGIVGGSERTERFLLWPMGVRSPGAMRQWGRHAIAFVGRRHFDDPYLFETLFTYRK